MEAMFKVQKLTSYHSGCRTTFPEKWITIADYQPESKQRKYFEGLRKRCTGRFKLRSSAKNEFRAVTETHSFTFRIVKRY